MSRWHREHPEKGNQVEPDSSAHSYMQADALRKGEIMHPHLPQETCDVCSGGGLREIVFRERGHDIEDRQTAVGQWGDNNAQGHRTFLPVDDAAIYLFPDEVLHDDPASDEAKAGAAELEANRQAYDRKARLAENAEEMVRIIAVMTGAAEVDGMDERSNVWRSLLNDANALLDRIEATPEEGK